MKINNDLRRLILNQHNLSHVILTFVLTAFPLLPWWFGIVLLTIHEVTDGYKPWYSKYKPREDFSNSINWFRQNFLYSDHFSLQDFLIWNPLGMGYGLMLRVIIGY